MKTAHPVWTDADILEMVAARCETDSPMPRVNAHARRAFLTVHDGFVHSISTHQLVHRRHVNGLWHVQYAGKDVGMHESVWSETTRLFDRFPESTRRAFLEEGMSIVLMSGMIAAVIHDLVRMGACQPSTPAPTLEDLDDALRGTGYPNLDQDGISVTLGNLLRRDIHPVMKTLRRVEWDRALAYAQRYGQFF